MSFKHMASVRDLRGLTALQKLILYIVADRANAEGLCWPRQGTIAEDAGCSIRAVGLALARLEEMGFVHREARHAADGRRLADSIRVRTRRQAVSHARDQLQLRLMSTVHHVHVVPIVPPAPCAELKTRTAYDDEAIGKRAGIGYPVDRPSLRSITPEHARSILLRGAAPHGGGHHQPAHRRSTKGGILPLASLVQSQGLEDATCGSAAAPAALHHVQARGPIAAGQRG